MTFATLTFALFVAMVFALYWVLRERGAQNAAIVVLSLVFYGWWDWRYCALMVGSTLVDFVAGLVIERSPSIAVRRCALGVSIGICLGLLCAFKYFGFFAEGLRDLTRAIGWQLDRVTLEVVLPVGISFYTFQSMSYTIDVYRRRLRACRSVRDYLAFVMFFPQLVAGPIERAAHLLGEFQRPRTFSRAKAVDGCRQALWGLFKKAVVADGVAPLVDAAYGDPDAYAGGRLAIATVLFAFQIYCDFSGYSDIAIGTSRLFGIDLMRNFAYPYFSRDVTEFWRRWHISLSTWFRDYVFIPLGGSLGSPRQRALRILATFTLSGLWHGAGWNYLGWGGLNGAAVAHKSLAPGLVRRTAEDVPGGAGLLPSPADLARMAGTFAFVCATWVLFRATSFSDGAHILARIVCEPRLGVHRLPAPGLLSEKAVLGMVAIFVCIEWFTRRNPHALVVDGLPRVLRWPLYTLILWLTFALMPHAPSSFIYFQF